MPSMGSSSHSDSNADCSNVHREYPWSSEKSNWQAEECSGKGGYSSNALLVLAIVKASGNDA